MVFKQITERQNESTMKPHVEPTEVSTCIMGRNENYKNYMGSIENDRCIIQQASKNLVSKIGPETLVRMECINGEERVVYTNKMINTNLRVTIGNSLKHHHLKRYRS